jgi:hypothetical protein
MVSVAGGEVGLVGGGAEGNGGQLSATRIRVNAENSLFSPFHFLASVLPSLHPSITICISSSRRSPGVP